MTEHETIDTMVARRAVERITEAEDEILAAERLLWERINVARMLGATWATIGAACGVTRQAIQQRHARLSGVFGTDPRVTLEEDGRR